MPYNSATAWSAVVQLCAEWCALYVFTGVKPSSDDGSCLFGPVQLAFCIPFNN